MKLSYYEKGPKKGEINLDETLLSMSRYERWVVKPEQTGSFLYAVSFAILSISDAAKEQPERGYTISYSTLSDEITIYRAI